MLTMKALLSKSDLKLAMVIIVAVALPDAILFALLRIVK
jgi:hypothetical protein